MDKNPKRRRIKAKSVRVKGGIGDPTICKPRSDAWVCCMNEPITKNNSLIEVLRDLYQIKVIFNKKPFIVWPSREGEDVCVEAPGSGVMCYEGNCINLQGKGEQEKFINPTPNSPDGSIWIELFWIYKNSDDSMETRNNQGIILSSIISGNDNASIEELIPLEYEKPPSN